MPSSSDISLEMSFRGQDCWTVSCDVDQVIGTREAFPLRGEALGITVKLRLCVDALPFQRLEADLRKPYQMAMIHSWNTGMY